MSHTMDRSTARNLSNDFQAVRLYSLRRWPDAAWYAPPESGGPYVIMQVAIDPEDLGADIDEFVLGRDGRWRPLALFFRLPWPRRDELFLFSTAAEAIAVMQGLAPRPVVDRTVPAEVAPEPPDADHAAFRAAIQPVTPG